MRKITSILLSVIFCMSILSVMIYAAEGADISVITTNACVGEEAVADIVIKNPSGAIGSSFNIVYDNTALEFVSAHKGEALGAANTFINPNYASDSIRFISSAVSVPIAEGTMLSVRFKAMKAGSFPIVLEKVKVYNSEPTQVLSSVSNGTINVLSGKEGIAAENIIVLDSNGNQNKLTSGVHTISADISNYTDNEDGVGLYAAEYSSEEQMLCVSAVTEKIPSRKSRNITLKITPRAETAYIRLFVFKDNLCPLTDESIRIGR